MDVIGTDDTKVVKQSDMHDCQAADAASGALPDTNANRAPAAPAPAGEWQILITTTNPAVATTGAPDEGEFYIDPKTYEAKLHYLRPEEKEYFRWLNHMNDIGLLDPESFVQKYDQYKAKVASGRVLGLIDADWDGQEPPSYTYGTRRSSIQAAQLDVVDGKLVCDRDRPFELKLMPPTCE